WFNQPYMISHMAKGQWMLMSGKVRRRGGRWQMSHPKLTPWEPSTGLPAGEILPVYSLTQGLNQSAMRRLTQMVVDQHAEQLDEVFPEPFLQQHQLLPIAQAVRQIHAPADAAQIEAARRRF